MSNILKKYRIKEAPLTTLIVFNLLAIILALIFRWRTFDLVLIFWTENLVIGIFNVVKIISLTRKAPGKAGCTIFLIPFFLVHYFGFCLGHGLFIALVLSPEKITAPGLFGPILEITFTWAFVYGFIAMLISHWISFKKDFINKKEYLNTKGENLMTDPYRRIFVIQFLIGGLALIILKNSVDSFLAVLLVVLVKMIFDIYLYNKKRSQTTHLN